MDERALADALADGHLGEAAVDVYAEEPPGRGCPLLSLPPAAADRILLTPHIAGVAYEAARLAYHLRACYGPSDHRASLPPTSPIALLSRTAS